MADHDNPDLTGDIAPKSLPAFEHEPFKRMESHIRLVRIINPRSQHIHLELQHAEIGETVERGYDALSYTWGHDALQKDLIINGKHFVARDNLYQYLHRAKSAIPMDRRWGGWLWIDQICIDQSNLLERNQQVSIMSWIYSRAHSVTIWLGNGSGGQCEEHAHARYAMAMFHLLDSLDSDVSEFLLGGRQAHGKKTLADVKAMPPDDWHQWNRNGQIKYQTKVKLQDPTPFNTLLSNSYWTRLWIVQEVFLAARINIEWCSYQATWLALKRFVDFKPGFKGVMDAPMVIRQSRPIWSENNRRYDFPWLLQNFGSHDCVDPRDKVFGLLAVGKHDFGVVADYRNDTVHVFLDAAYRLLLGMVTVPKNPGSQQQNRGQLRRWLDIVARLRVSMLPERVFDEHDLSTLKENFRRDWEKELVSFCAPRPTVDADVQALTVIRTMYRLPFDGLRTREMHEQ